MARDALDVTGQPDGTPAQSESGRVIVRRPDRAERGGARYATRVRWGGRLLGLAVPVLAFIAWEICANIGVVDVRLFSSPSHAWEAGTRMASSGELGTQTWVTVKRLLIGFGAGAVVGCLMGLLLSQSVWLRSLFDLTLRALYTVPKLAVLPLLLLVFGIGDTPKIMFVAIGTFFIVFFAALGAGLRVPYAYLEVAKSHNLSRIQQFRRVVLPASMPEIVDGLKIASGVAVLLVLAVEFVNSNDGLGYVIWQSWQLFAADRTYFGILVVSLVGVLFSGLIGLGGKLLMPWQQHVK